ncbi:MAG: zinc-ribbon domain-containing protein [Promethearchaeota archaeon]
MNSSQVEKVRKKFAKEHGFELTTQEAAQYNNFQIKISSSSGCGIVFGAIIILFIVFGIFAGLLPWNIYTIVPLFIIAILVISNANSLTKKINENDKKFMQYILQQRQANSVPAPKIVPSPTTVPPPNSNLTPKPKAASFCPVCGEKIPMGSDPCPKCGSPLVWE